MKARLATVFGLLIVVVLLVLTHGQAAFAQSGTRKQVSYGGVSFSYDASLAKNVVGETVAERIEEMLPPEIYVLPVRSSYREFNPSEEQDFWLPQINLLRSLLAKRPDLNAQGDKLPFLPPINAGTFVVGKQAYVQFRSGQGVRYLVQITQEVRPVGPADTIYTFQGLSNDGRYYVAARFPAFPTAPLDVTLNANSQEELEEYYRQVREEMNQRDDNTFMPNLNSLDEIMASLSTDSAVVGQYGGATPGMPRTGDADNGALWSSTLLGIVLALVALGFALRHRQATGSPQP